MKMYALLENGTAMSETAQCELHREPGLNYEDCTGNDYLECNTCGYSGVEKPYTVTWTVQVNAESPEDAAWQAFGMMNDPNNTATVFAVTDEFDITRVFDVDPITEKAYKFSF